MKPMQVMKTSRTVKRTTILAVAAALLLMGGAFYRVQDAALAQTGNGYDLTWISVDGGGHTFSTGGSYELGGTIGQPDAGPLLADGTYTLAGGFWGGAITTYQLYLPLVLKSFSS